MLSIHASHGTVLCMEHDEAVLTALRRGEVEYCVLALLANGERYGLDIAKTLSANGVLMNGEGTLYPLLSRFRRHGYVDTQWRESPSGPPRRYYLLTDEGRSALTAYLKDLDRSLSTKHPDDRIEILDGVNEHIQLARAA